MAFFELLADEQAEIISGGFYSRSSTPTSETPAPMKHSYKPFLPGLGWSRPVANRTVTTTVDVLAMNIATSTASGIGSVAMAGNQGANIGINIGR